MSLDDIKSYFEDKPVECQKFNFALEEEVQNWCSFRSIMHIKDDEIQILNRKPRLIEDKVYKKMQGDIFKNKNTGNDIGFMSGNGLKDDDHFKIVKSSASCKIDDVIGFIYGAQSSRFWMLRKYLISMPQKKENQFQILKSWNCITLQLRNRDVDLVINDDKDMKIFLKYLIISLRTINGRKDSGSKLLDALRCQEEEDYKFTTNQHSLPKSI